MSLRLRPFGGPGSRLGIITGSLRTLGLPGHILRQPAEPVDFDTVSRAERWDLVRGLLRALHAGPPGVGLAAPMAGVGLRVVVLTVDGEPLAMFNPSIVATDGPERAETEANLTLPGVRATVVRRHSVTVEWQSINSGQSRTATFDGWLARVLMHEIEILDGRLFIDHASSPVLGEWLSDEERARRGTVAIFSGHDGAPPHVEALGLALLPPSLHRLSGVLTRPAADVDHKRLQPGQLRSLLQGMLRVLYAQRGVGLAAPQVGLGLRLVVIDSGEKPPLVLINPQIIDRDERQDITSEGCLSVPGWRGEVSRAVAVKVRTDTVRGEIIEMDFSGYAARIAQHEIDHVDGVLFTERMDAEAGLIVTDPDVQADNLLRELEQRERVESRSAARHAQAHKRDGNPKRRHRR